MEFERFLAPMPQEAASRVAAVERIAAVVQAIWPAASVQVFGSFATGACAPLLSNGGLLAALCAVPWSLDRPGFQLLGVISFRAGKFSYTTAAAVAWGTCV